MNNMLRGSRMPSIGYCRVHGVPIPAPYWTTCRELIRWDFAQTEWEEAVRLIRERDYDEAEWERLILRHATGTPEPLVMADLMTSPLKQIVSHPASGQGALFSTADYQPIERLPLIEELEVDPKHREGVAAIRRAIRLDDTSADPVATVRAVAELAAREGPFDLLIAANETRWLVRRHVDTSLVARAMGAVLSGLEDDDRFQYFHAIFDTVCSSLYLGWLELPEQYARLLPEVPGFNSLLEDEGLRRIYERIFAPDRLPMDDTSATEEERQMNFRRAARLRALFEFQTLQRLMPLLGSAG